ncbi:hypothetical protein F4780DRAFT_285336 [Xylariomycetidae sp. FL0641]|nr:hypothetical protein F4780DRAFT_285336 [Xylariomycetidae sp. FL0641]
MRGGEERGERWYKRATRLLPAAGWWEAVVVLLAGLTNLSLSLSLSLQQLATLNEPRPEQRKLPSRYPQKKTQGPIATYILSSKMTRLTAAFLLLPLLLLAAAAPPQQQQHGRRAQDCDAATGACFSSATVGVAGIRYGVAIPAGAAGPFDALLRIEAPRSVGWAGIAWGGHMINNTITMAWANGNSSVVSSRWARYVALVSCFRFFAREGWGEAEAEMGSVPGEKGERRDEQDGGGEKQPKDHHRRAEVQPA